MRHAGECKLFFCSRDNFTQGNDPEPSRLWLLKAEEHCQAVRYRKSKKIFYVARQLKPIIVGAIGRVFTRLKNYSAVIFNAAAMQTMKAPL